MPIPGSQPRRVSMTFSKNAQEQHPFSIATATGGKKKHQKILQTSEQVTAIEKMGLPNQ